MQNFPAIASNKNNVAQPFIRPKQVNTVAAKRLKRAKLLKIKYLVYLYLAIFNNWVHASCSYLFRLEKGRTAMFLPETAVVTFCI